MRRDDGWLVLRWRGIGRVIVHADDFGFVLAFEFAGCVVFCAA